MPGCGIFVEPQIKAAAMGSRSTHPDGFDPAQSCLDEFFEFTRGQVWQRPSSLIAGYNAPLYKLRAGKLIHRIRALFESDQKDTVTVEL